MAAETACGSKLWASLNYLLPDRGEDADGYYAGTAGTLRRRFDARNVVIADIRDAAETFRLDKHGFQFVRREGRFSKFDDWFLIIDQYYSEVNQLVKMQYVYAPSLQWNRLIPQAVRAPRTYEPSSIWSGTRRSSQRWRKRRAKRTPNLFPSSPQVALCTLTKATPVLAGIWRSL